MISAVHPIWTQPQLPEQSRQKQHKDSRKAQQSPPHGCNPCPKRRWGCVPKGVRASVWGKTAGTWGCVLSCRPPCGKAWCGGLADRGRETWHADLRTMLNPQGCSMWGSLVEVCAYPGQLCAYQARPLLPPELQLRRGRLRVPARSAVHLLPAATGPFGAAGGRRVAASAHVLYEEPCSAAPIHPASHALERPCTRTAASLPPSRR